MSGKNSNNENLSNSQNEENALWSIVGYLLSGLLIWGGIGWGLDRWLGTTYLVLVLAPFWARLRSPNLHQVRFLLIQISR